MSEKKVITVTISRELSQYIDTYSGINIDTIIERLQKAKEEFYLQYKNVIDVFAYIETEEYYGSIDTNMIFTITRLETDVEFKKRLETAEKQKKTKNANIYAKRKQKIAEEKETLRKLAKKHPKVLKELE